MTEADLVVVGAGLFGLTIAERVATQLHKRVLILERRDHIGGNAYSEIDPESGIEIHRYGTHLFHTSNERVWSYVNLFTSFNSYRHRVVAMQDGQPYPFPINLQTMSQFFGRAFTPAEAKQYFENQRSPRSEDSLELKAISMIGEELYEAFIKHYTEKQWQTPATKLPSSTISRIPVRYNYQDRYFTDTHEGLPLLGYSEWFAKMIASELVTVRTGHDFLHSNGAHSRLNLIGRVPVVYSGPIDEYFSFDAGRLGWRTIDLQLSREFVDDFQGISVMNFVDATEPFTRRHEFKHLHPERSHTPGQTIIAHEYSRFASPNDEPYYPIQSKSDIETLTIYRRRAAAEHGVIFGGRLGTYKYLDMHAAIGSALTCFDNEVRPLLES